MEKSLECVPNELKHHRFLLKEHINFAQLYFILERFNDARNCVKRAKTLCQESTGIEPKMFENLFPLGPKLETLLYKVRAFFMSQKFRDFGSSKFQFRNCRITDFFKC